MTDTETERIDFYRKQLEVERIIRLRMAQEIDRLNEEIQHLSESIMDTLIEVTA